MVKVNNKTPERCYFTPCSSVFIFNFEQVNAGCEEFIGLKSTGQASLFSCFYHEKGLGNSGKCQDYLVSCSTVKFWYIYLDFKSR